jgi:hypothetical protein
MVISTFKVSVLEIGKDGYRDNWKKRRGDFGKGKIGKDDAHLEI